MGPSDEDLDNIVEHEFDGENNDMLEMGNEGEGMGENNNYQNQNDDDDVLRGLAITPGLYQD